MLPIRKVVLFKHGVGFFEREGEVTDDASVDLAFKSAEMNDVLKSLTVLDLGGGHIASISYESTQPTEKRLEDVAFRLPEGGSLSGLCEQLKGAHVEVEIGSERVAGTVAGVETVWRRVEQESLHVHRLVLLCDGERLRSFELLELKSLRLLDDSVRKDLGHLLDILIGAKKKDLKRLTIFARGEGTRPLVASYVVETPVWKTSYRVILSEDKPLIQGWALVDNTQDEDWNDVRLSLVAGLPVSFIHDLYSPRYRRRPTVRVEVEEAYAPPVIEDALYEAAAFAPPPPQARPAPAAPPMASAPRQAPPRTMARAESMAVQTRTEKVGDLFEYAIERPVTVKRNQSALVPILSTTFGGKRVALFNRSVRESNPMSAILFENTTGLTLEGGPVTVLEGERYLGEAMLETLKPKEERLMPYSVELGCTIALDHRSHQRAVHRSTIQNGTLFLQRYIVTETIYRVRNKTDDAIDLFLEHPIQTGHALVDTPEPVATTRSYYRFRFDVAARAEHTFSVQERGDDVQRLALLSVDRAQLQVWYQSQYLDDDVRATLEQVADLLSRAAELRAEAEARQAEIQHIHADQQRLRENLKALGQSSDEQRLRERYVSELSREEDHLRALTDALATAQRDAEMVSRQAREAVMAMQFERTL